MSFRCHGKFCPKTVGLTRFNPSITPQAAIRVHYSLTAVTIRLSFTINSHSWVQTVECTLIFRIISSSNTTRLKTTCHKMPTTTTSTDTRATRVTRLRTHATPLMASQWTITTSAASTSPPATITIRAYGIRDLTTVTSWSSTFLIPYLNPVAAALSSRTSANGWVAKPNNYRAAVLVLKLTNLKNRSTIACIHF